MKIKQPIRRFLHFSASAVILLALAGCAPTVTIKEPPVVTGPSATVTIVRKSQFIGSGPTHYIELDGITIVGLRVGQYTKFTVPEGYHSLTVTWFVGDKLVGVGGFGAGVAWIEASPYEKKTGQNFEASKSYFFTLSSTLLDVDNNNRTDFMQVDSLQGEFALEGKTLVPPGPGVK